MNKKILYIGNVKVIKINSANVAMSKDYNLQPLPTNRYCGFENQEKFVSDKEKKLCRKHIDSIKLSMKKFGESLGYDCPIFDDREPIIVFEINGKLFMIDGQHRYVAAMELGIPFYFMVVKSDLVDKKGMSLSASLDYAEEFYKRINNTISIGGSVKWNSLNYISAEARKGNKIALHIYDICSKNDLFEPTYLNYSTGLKRNSKIYGVGKNYGAIDLPMIDKNITSDMVIKRIDDYANLAEIMAMSCYRHFKSDKNYDKRKAVKALIRTDRFRRAVQYILHNDIDWIKASKAASKASTGRIPYAKTEDYLISWGITKK